MGHTHTPKKKRFLWPTVRVRGCLCLLWANGRPWPKQIQPNDQARFQTSTSYQHSSPPIPFGRNAVDVLVVPEFHVPPRIDFGKHLSAPSLSDVDCCSVAWEMPFDMACFPREAATHGENPTDNAKTYSKLSQFWNNHFGLKNKRVCPKISQNREFHDEHWFFAWDFWVFPTVSDRTFANSACKSGSCWRIVAWGHGQIFQWSNSLKNMDILWYMLYIILLDEYCVILNSP